MKERLFFLFGVGGILLLTICAAAFFQRRPDTASLLGGALLLTGVPAFMLYRLTVWLAPRLIAEKRLEALIKRGTTAWILRDACEAADCDDDSTDEDRAPAWSFSVSLERREGLKTLCFSGEPHPEIRSELLNLEPDTELTAAFSNGTKSLYLIGTIQLFRAGQMQKDCQFQLSVHRARLSNRKKEFLI